MKKDNKFIYAIGKILYKTLLLNEYTQDKFDTYPMIHFTLKDGVVNYNDINIEPEYKPNWYGSNETISYINCKSKYPVKIYETTEDNKAVRCEIEKLHKGDVVEVAFKVTEKYIIPNAIRIIESNAYNPFDR